MDTEHTCAMCGEGTLHLMESEQVVEVDGARLSVPFHTHACKACGSKQALDDDLRFNARAMRGATKRHYGLLTGQEVREIRKCLRLNQEQAAQLFGGGPVAFSKYENEDVTQSEAMDRLIWLAGKYPWLLESLAGRLRVPLFGEANFIIEQSQPSFELFSSIEAQLELAREALEEFPTPSIASNDEIYYPNEDPRPAKRMSS